MASKTVTRTYADGTIKTMLRKKQGSNPGRKCVKFLLRLPVEYYELMLWKNEECGGCLSVTSQIQSAIRANLCGCVYTQLLIH